MWKSETRKYFSYCSVGYKLEQCFFVVVVIVVKARISNLIDIKDRK